MAAARVHPDSDRLVALTEQHAPQDRLTDMTQVFEQMAGYHPPEPCWYLPLIGVDPARQGRGYGSALLRHTLDQVDRDRVPAYLESSNPRNVPLYERHGFEILGSIQAGFVPDDRPDAAASALVCSTSTSKRHLSDDGRNESFRAAPRIWPWVRLRHRATDSRVEEKLAVRGDEHVVSLPQEHLLGQGA